jgi:signal transduction histidine kinase
VRKNLEDAEQNSQRLARLVDRLLDAAQIQANKLEMQAETVDLAAIVYTKVREQRLATPARAIRYKVRPMRAIPTLIDPERIGEVLQNYLANALKYSPEDSVVEVTFGVRDGVARISVRDMGLGIPTADQQRIWSRFEQLRDTQHRGSAVGLGLGLYISRAIVEAHGGLVGVESEVGSGSTFWFEVPLDPHSD